MYPQRDTPPQQIRTRLGLIKLHIVLISSLNPGGGYIWGGCIVTPNRSGCQSGIATSFKLVVQPLPRLFIRYSVPNSKVEHLPVPTILAFAKRMGGGLSKLWYPLGTSNPSGTERGAQNGTVILITDHVHVIHSLKQRYGSGCRSRCLGFTV